MLTRPHNSMSGICHRITQYFNPEPKSWEEYVESVGLGAFCHDVLWQ